MNIVGRSILSGSLAAVLAACSHAAGSSGAPLVPDARAPRLDSARTRLSATLIVRVPPHRRGHRRRDYVSPSTQSIVFTTQETAPANGSAVTAFANLTAGSPGCTGNGTPPYSCSVTIPNLTAGATYSFTFVTYDATQTSAGGPYNGHELAQNTVSKTIALGADNTIGITLEGVPVSFVVVPAPGTVPFGGGAAQGYDFGFRDSPALTIAALDADGNYIVGPGSPVIGAALAPGATGGLSFASAPLKGNVNRFVASATGLGSGTLVVSAQVPGTLTAVAAAIPLTAGTFTSTVAGTPNYEGTTDGAGDQAQFYEPEGVAYDPVDGNLYIADYANCTIRKLVPATMVVSTVAGSPSNCSFQNGTGSTAWFNYPFEIAVDSAGNLYVTDNSNYAIRKIAPGGVVTTLTGNNGSGTAGGGPGTAQFAGPAGIAFDPDDDDLYVSDDSACTIRRVTLGGSTPGTVTTIAGTAGNCDANGSDLGEPYGLTYAGNGTLFVADYGNCEIRRITNVDGAPTIDTVANPFAGNTGCSWADGTGTTAGFDDPEFLTFDAKHNLLYVTDYYDNTVRAVNPTTAAVSTLAGTPSSAQQHVDGWSARFGHLEGVAYDTQTGTLFVCDYQNYTIEEISL